MKDSGQLLPPNPKKKYQIRKDGELNIRQKFIPYDKKSKISPRLILKCGCCDTGTVRIYFDKHGIEINDVHGSIGNWKEIFEKIFKLCEKKAEDIKW